MRHPRALLVSVVMLAVLGAACGGGSNRPTLAPHSTPGPAPVAPASLIAKVNVAKIGVYASPTSKQPSQTFDNPWPLNDDAKLPVPQVFLVEQRQGTWFKVLLPVRPNGTTGWVRGQDVLLAQDPYRITVQLGAHLLKVYKGDAVMLQDFVAIGQASTPTPMGTYYLRVLLKAPDPTTVYGPYAYGLSGHSEALNTFDGGDAEIGIHGNNDTSVLGKDISHGCIRMSNDKITTLASILPLGTVVQITA